MSLARSDAAIVAVIVEAQATAQQNEHRGSFGSAPGATRSKSRLGSTLTGVCACSYALGGRPRYDGAHI
jgi:hypothetical protein